MGAKTAATVNIRCDPRSTKRWSRLHRNRTQGRTTASHTTVPPKIISKAGLSPAVLQLHSATSASPENVLMPEQIIILSSEGTMRILPLTAILSSFKVAYRRHWRNKWRITIPAQTKEIGMIIITYWSKYCVTAWRQSPCPHMVKPVRSKARHLTDDHLRDGVRAMYQTEANTLPIL